MHVATIIVITHLILGERKRYAKRGTDLSALAVSQTAASWNVDALHSVAEFKVKHMMISNAKGQFSGVTGVLTFDESVLNLAHVQASIDAPRSLHAMRSTTHI